MDVNEQQRQAAGPLAETPSEITHSEHELQTIIDTIPTLVWRSRSDGSAEFFNRRWLDYTGMSAEEADDC